MDLLNVKFEKFDYHFIKYILLIEFLRTNSIIKYFFPLMEFKY